MTFPVLVFENAWWVVGSAVLCAVGVALWVRAGRHSRRWKVACVFLPMVAAVMVSLALAGPVVVHDPRAERVVVLLDRSGSAGGGAWGGAAWVRGLMQERLARDVLVTVVGFGGKGGPRVLVQDLPAGAAESRWPLSWNGGHGGGE